MFQVDQASRHAQYKWQHSAHHDENMHGCTSLYKLNACPIAETSPKQHWATSEPLSQQRALHE
jgi:hypothetical protein